MHYTVFLVVVQPVLHLDYSLQELTLKTIFGFYIIMKMVA